MASGEEGDPGMGVQGRSQEEGTVRLGRAERAPGKVNGSSVLLQRTLPQLPSPFTSLFNIMHTHWNPRNFSEQFDVAFFSHKYRYPYRHTYQEIEVNRSVPLSSLSVYPCSSDCQDFPPLFLDFIEVEIRILYLFVSGL